MNIRFWTLALIASALCAAAAPAQAPFWTAICRGEKDANYTQTVGGDGVFNQGLGDGTYQTLPVKQTTYDGNVVCGAAAGASQVAQVCADNAKQVIVVKIHDAKHPKAPLQAMVYCKALVKIH